MMKHFCYLILQKLCYQRHSCSSTKETEKREKTKFEKAMDKTVGAFLQFQTEAQERFEELEEERVKKEMELEERHLRAVQRMPGEDDHANRADAQGARPSLFLLTHLNYSQL